MDCADACVATIRATARGGPLASARDAMTGSLVADQVIAAVPPRLLEAIVALTPGHDAVTARRWGETPTWMAPHAEFFALYDRPL